MRLGIQFVALAACIICFSMAGDPNEVLNEEQAKLYADALKRFSLHINKVKDQLKELGKANLKKTPILSPSMADAELQVIPAPQKHHHPNLNAIASQQLEAILHIKPRFTQLLNKQHLRILRQHNHLKDDNDQPELEKEEEKEGEKEAESFVKDNSGPGKELESPKDFVDREIKRILKVANDAASITTGINDYMGFEAKEQEKRAKAVADLTLAAGFGPETAAYTSGESPDQIKGVENEAKAEEAKEAKEGKGGA